MITRISSAVLEGIEIRIVDVEVGFSRGIPGVIIVGLPDNSVRESRERIKLALRSSNLEFPQTRIVVNLSPADLRKEGAALDLPIAIGIIMNSARLKSGPFRELLFYGEVNLDGRLNSVRGVLNLAIKARECGFRGVVVPRANASEAAAVEGLEVFSFETLSEVVEFVKYGCDGPAPVVSASEADGGPGGFECDLGEIRGQLLARRALEVAAAGGHHMLMIGPPGAGKSMLAKALLSILPEMDYEESLQTSLVYSAAGLLPGGRGLMRRRPFRSPHNTISDIGMSGGGRNPLPGEISLAHNGVLFLDELPFFRKSALEVLRQPLEDGRITISRALQAVTFPASFQLIAALNPCEDAYGVREEYFRCTQQQKRSYYGKISKPLLDRIDIQIEVKKVPLSEITGESAAEGSEAVRDRVMRARRIQLERFRHLRRRIFTNSQMRNPEIRKFCALTPEDELLMQKAAEKYGLTARSYFKVLKVARTIADLTGSPLLSGEHLQEALRYRALDLATY